MGLNYTSISFAFDEVKLYCQCNITTFTSTKNYRLEKYECSEI